MPSGFGTTSALSARACATAPGSSRQPRNADPVSRPAVSAAVCSRRSRPWKTHAVSGRLSRRCASSLATVSNSRGGWSAFIIAACYVGFGRGRRRRAGAVGGAIPIGAIRAERPLHRLALLAVDDPPGDQHRVRGGDPEQPRHGPSRSPGLDLLRVAAEGVPVVVDEDAIQRIGRQVAPEQRRAHRHRYRRQLVAHRGGVGEAQALDEEHRVARLQTEAAGEGGIGRAAVEAEQP